MRCRWCWTPPPSMAKAAAGPVHLAMHHGAEGQAAALHPAAVHKHAAVAAHGLNADDHTGIDAGLVAAAQQHAADKLLAGTPTTAAKDDEKQIRRTIAKICEDLQQIVANIKILLGRSLKSRTFCF